VSQDFKARIIVGETKSVEFYGPADITLETTEAIVNAANSSLLGGGGVDGAIHDAGGSSILEECRQYVVKNGRLPAGKAMLTSGGQLAAKHVIHTVGPVYRGGDNNEHELLASCYRESIRIAEAQQIKSLSFPAISTGAYGYPMHEAARIAVTAVLDALENTKDLERVRFVLFDIAALHAYVKAARTLVKTRWQCRLDGSPLIL
jgi:O-acetyl-ADP-ribose deacetylase (regulator of RNase III)